MHADLAASVQRRLEEVLLELACWAHERTGEPVLTMAGGVVLNCVANSRILEEGPFDEVWAQPAAGDSGTALGAAMHLAVELGDEVEPMPGAALGRGFEERELSRWLSTAAIEHERPHGRASSRESFAGRPSGSPSCMRIAITGATGNVGTSLIRALSQEPKVDTVLGIARRAPQVRLPKTSWAQADVLHSDLTELFRGADAVVHLAWLIQPSRDKRTLDAVNVEGSARVFHAAGAAGVPRLVYASSIGAYAPGPKDRRVDESWPTDGIESSYYSVQKSQVERRLDRFEAEAPEVRVVRLRPGLIFKRDAASGIRRLFAGPFLPSRLLRPGMIPFVPDTERLVFQAVHSHDVGEAYRLAVVNDEARGAYNVAAEPVLDPSRIAGILKARTVRVPQRVLHGATDAAWRLRLQPAEASWIDLALGTPLMDVTRAREELGWTPRRGADEALVDLLEGIREGAGYGTPPLARATSGPLRIRELLTGVGRRVGMTQS